LAFEAYTHFTSPIRRYPDLLVHRVIKAILGKVKYQLPNLPTPGEAHAKLSKRLEKNLASRVAEPGIKPRKPNAETQAWQSAGLHCSANERRADEASRDVEAWLKCKYMREHLGEEFTGVVTAVTSFGIFVTLDAMYVEGLIHITELGGEYFRFDELRQELRGERTGMRYALGSRVKVQVSRVDLDGRRIDFRLMPEADSMLTRSSKERGFLREASSAKGLDDELDLGRSGSHGVGAGGRPAKRAASKRPVAQPAQPAKSKDKARKSRRRS
jgi:ribonuclease R